MSVLSPVEMWAIYDHPADFPDVFIARKWHVLNGAITHTKEVKQHVDIETLRSGFALSGLYCLPRFDKDDPKIVEVWL